MISPDELEEALQTISAYGKTKDDSQDGEELAELQIYYGALAWAGEQRHQEAKRFADKLRGWQATLERKRTR